MGLRSDAGRDHAGIPLGTRPPYDADMGHDDDEAARRDEAAIAEIVERLTAHFPKKPHAAIVEAVREALHHFSRAKVRDFVPILVEREAKARLERPTR